MRKHFLIVYYIVCVARAVRADGAEPLAKHVVIISVDGMRPAEYLSKTPNRMPTLSGMVESGCASSGAVGVFPSVTFPNHTAMVTGQPPVAHGILSNTVLDPMALTTNDWYYFAEQIQKPTLWDEVRKAGGATAAVGWPVTVGASINYLIPEYRAMKTEDDAALLRALSTPGLLREVEGAYGKMPVPLEDAWRADAASFIFRKYKPALLLLHLQDTDHAQHSYGPDSPQAIAAFAQADVQIARFKAEAEAAAGREGISWVIVSDHGFQPVGKELNPKIVLRQLGYISYDPGGAVRSWRIFPRVAGATFALVAKDPADHEAIANTIRRFQELAADPRNGIGRIYSQAELQTLGAFPDAFLAIEMAAGFTSGEKAEGEIVSTAASKGMHGYSPASPPMLASLILAGAGIRHCDAMKPARLVDVAPIVAALLGLDFPENLGKGHSEAMKTPGESR